LLPLPPALLIGFQGMPPGLGSRRRFGGSACCIIFAARASCGIAIPILPGGGLLCRTFGIREPAG